MKTGVVILARCKSERFPGKVVAPLAGRPVLSWIIDKAKVVQADTVIVATSIEPEDDKVADLCHARGVHCYRGPDRDVLTRIIGCWDHHGLTHAVEFSGDSPFVDVSPAIRIHMAICRDPSAADAYDCDFYPHGVLGIMSVGRARSFWNKLAALVSEQPKEDRETYIEWPWGLFHRDPGRFTSCRVATADLYPPDKTPINLCVDYPLQLWFLDKLARRLGGVPNTYAPVERAFRDLVEL